MKKKLKAVAIALVSMLALGVGAFFSVGGAQMLIALRGARLPLAPQQLTMAADIDYLRAGVIANEHGASILQFDRFKEIIDQGAAPQSVDDVTLLATRALAAFDNAHTTTLSPTMRQLPIRLHWTADALIIVKARPEYAMLLGQKIVSLGNRSPEEMLQAMPALVGGGTPGWVRYRSEYFYTAPTALAFLGALTQNNQVELRTIDELGLESVQTLHADEGLLPGDPFWDFLHCFPGDTSFQTTGWATLLQAGTQEIASHQTGNALPLYQQEAKKLFLLRALPRQKAVYLRMNASFDDSDESIAQFTTRVLTLLQTQEAQNLIVDFRYNRGGDYTLSLPLIRALSLATPATGRLYVITGPNTFSAGLIAASQFKRFLKDRLTVVGEDVGDRLRFRGEGLILTLPKTKVALYLGTAWDDVATDCGWFADCWPPNKFLLRGVRSMSPNIRVANTWSSYRSRRDLVLETITADIESNH